MAEKETSEGVQLKLGQIVCRYVLMSGDRIIGAADVTMRSCCVPKITSEAGLSAPELLAVIDDVNGLREFLGWDSEDIG